ncbi:MAG: hypothetical protein ACLUVD_03025 [Mediterraneibacter faecis]
MDFSRKSVSHFGINLKDERDYGVGMFFLPQDELKRNQAKKIFEVIVKKEGLKFLGWREVPIHPDMLGKTCSGLYAMYHAGIYRTSGKGMRKESGL